MMDDAERGLEDDVDGWVFLGGMTAEELLRGRILTDTTPMRMDCVAAVMLLWGVLLLWLLVVGVVLVGSWLLEVVMVTGSVCTDACMSRLLT